MYQRNALETLRIDQYCPEGWLKDQLELQLEGITLHLDEVWGSVGSFSDWIGGTDNSWERPPYWLDGLVPLSCLTQSREGMEKAERWMEWALNSQREDGDFGPTYRKTDFDETLFWPKYVVLKAMISYYEKKQEPRILEFMERYFAFCNRQLDTYRMGEWAQARGGDLAYSICWLYDKTGKEELLEVLEKVNAQTLPWAEYMANFPFTRPTGFYYPWRLIADSVSRTYLYDVMKYHATHIVNVAMGVKQPIFMFKATGDKKYLDAFYQGLRDLTKYHGQVTGAFSGDEHLNGPAPTQGTELCSVVELMFSLQLAYAQTKDARMMDLLERLAYNALPATITEDFKGHQYDQQVNQVKVTAEERNWYNNGNRANLFGLEPNFGCCLANMHQGWPKFVKNAFFVSDDTVTAAAYMPVTAQFTVKGSPITIQEETEYPFREQVRFRFTLEKEIFLSFRLRVPGWCKCCRVEINGTLAEEAAKEGYLTLNRSFRNQDVVAVTWKMEVRTEKGWYHNGVTVERGPLLYALNIGEKWAPMKHGRPDYPDYEIYPESDWNYALDLAEDMEVTESPGLARQAFSKKEAPVHIKAWGRKVDSWKEEKNSAGDLPQSPVAAAAEKEELDLIPYGCSKLRIGLFPWV